MTKSAAKRRSMSKQGGFSPKTPKIEVVGEDSIKTEKVEVENGTGPNELVVVSQGNQNNMTKSLNDVKSEVKSEPSDEVAVNTDEKKSARKRNKKRKGSVNRLADEKSQGKTEPSDETAPINDEQGPAKKRMKKEGGNLNGHTKTKVSTEAKNEVKPINYDRIYQIWAQVVDQNSKKHVNDYLKDLSNHVEGHATKLVFLPKTTKVIERLIARPQSRDFIFNELKGKILPMSESKNAKVAVIAILKNGRLAQKNHVIEIVTKYVLRFIKHPEAVSVLDAAFEVATDFQRQSMTDPFYSVYKSEENLQTPPKKLQPQLGFLKQTIKELVKTPAVSCSLVHRLLRIFFKYSHEAEKSEIIHVVKQKLIGILDTTEGHQVALQCVWHGLADHHRPIIRSLAGHVTDICKQNKGQLVIMAIFDCVDNVELVMEVIVKEIMKDLNELVRHPVGRVVVSYLISRRKCFTSMKQIEILETGDNEKNIKNRDTREKQLLALVKPDLVKFLQDNLQESLLDSNVMKFVTSLTKAIDDFSLFDSGVIAKLAAESFGSNEANHIINSASGTFIIGKLIAQDKALFLIKAEIRPELFCEKLMKIMTPKNFVKWARNARGVHLLDKMRGVHETVEEKLKKILEPFREELKDEMITKNLVNLFSEK